ncbi:MAG: hypothetical protein KF888_10150 [Nitrosomonas sp.]|nr:hypothetical protein [Nitrosomonas sp.]
MSNILTPMMHLIPSFPKRSIIAKCNSLMARILQTRIGFEVMNTQAACRTHNNILMEKAANWPQRLFCKACRLQIGYEKVDIEICQ